MKVKKNSRKTIAGFFLLSLIIIFVVGAPLFTQYAPDEENAIERLQGFSLEHPFGTDRYGRDIFSRTLYGGRVTLLSAFSALGAALFIGVFFGYS